MYYDEGLGADEGAAIGKKVLGMPGEVVGFVVGGAYGAIKGFFDRIFG